MWRYKEFLPINDLKNIISLGEGGTPLFKANKLNKSAGSVQNDPGLLRFNPKIVMESCRLFIKTC